VIKDHGIDYERGKFQDKLNDGSLTLERTRGLIESIIRQGVTLGRFAMHDLTAGDAKVYVRVHMTALIDLISGETFNYQTIPETLILDTDRLALMNKSFRGLVGNISIAVAATQGLTSGAKRADKCAEKKQMLSELYDYLAEDTGFDIELTLTEIGNMLDVIGIFAGDDLR
jgi:hypothetical protein